MSADAAAHESSVRARAEQAIKNNEAEERAIEERQAKLRPEQPQPVQFIQQLNANVYSGSHETLAEPLKRTSITDRRETSINRHFRKRTHRTGAR
jgi:hypothetical protein